MHAVPQVGYLGLQCHGILWPVQDADLPHYWPIAPPIVSGKVGHLRGAVGLM